MSTIRLGKRGDVWYAYVDGQPMPPIALILWLQGIWRELTKPQQALLTAIGGGGRPLTPLRIIDLCAGIGTLSLACQARHEWDEHNGAPPLVDDAGQLLKVVADE